MRKILAFVLLAVLLVSDGVSVASGEDATSCAMPSMETDCATEGVMRTLGKERVFTRSGPGTAFRDTGTYTVEGGRVRVYACAYDDSGNCWVQCDFPYQKKLRRLYTRLEDVDDDCFDLSEIPQEQPLGYKVKVNAVTLLQYGPGDAYGTYGKSFKSTKGATVYIVTIDGDDALVQWTTPKQSYRVWVPTTILDD